MGLLLPMGRCWGGFTVSEWWLSACDRCRRGGSLLRVEAVGKGSLSMSAWDRCCLGVAVDVGCLSVRGICQRGIAVGEGLQLFVWGRCWRAVAAGVELLLVCDSCVQGVAVGVRPLLLWDRYRRGIAVGKGSLSVWGQCRRGIAIVDGQLSARGRCR